MGYSAGGYRFMVPVAGVHLAEAWDFHLSAGCVSGDTQRQK